MRYLTARLEIGQHRHVLADPREVVDVQLHARRMRDGEANAAPRWSRPPSAMTTVIAFSNALRVMMSSGRMPRPSQPVHRLRPARIASSFFSCETAFCAELFGKLMPSASIAPGHCVRRVHAGA